MIEQKVKNIILNIREPEKETKGVVLINTGTCIPQKVYWNFANFLVEHQYIAITYDYSDAQNFTSNVSHIDWLKDIDAAMQYIVEQYPSLKKYVVGHSSGGQLIGFSKHAQYFDKLFLVASTNGYWKYMKFPVKYFIWILWYLLVPLSIALNGYFNSKMYGVAGGFPRNIIMELRRFCLNPNFFISFFKEKNVDFYYDTITCPVKSYHLADDKLISEAGCRFILNMYDKAEKSLETLYAAEYGMKSFGHRGFFSLAAKQKLWYKFLTELD